MLAVVFPRRRRALAGAFAALVCVAAVVPQVLESAHAGTADRYANGTATGFPNSSATSWSLGTNSYEVRLRCTNQVGAGYKD